MLSAVALGLFVGHVDPRGWAIQGGAQKVALGLNHHIDATVQDKMK